jgi:hypothetical protein
MIRRTTSRKGIRTRKAHLGTVAMEGIRPVVAWVEGGKLYFHRQSSRTDPEPIPLSEIYNQATGRLIPG